MDVKTKTLKLATALTFNMVRRICLTVGAACIAASAMAQETSPFVGNWSGVWSHSGQHNEFNVLAVDAEGRITALYCTLKNDGSGIFFHVKPGGIESSIDGQVLRFKRPKRKYKYTLTGDDTLTFKYTRNGKTGTLKMSRQEPSGCAAGIAPAMPE